MTSGLTYSGSAWVNSSMRSVINLTISEGQYCPSKYRSEYKHAGITCKCCLFFGQLLAFGVRASFWNPYTADGTLSMNFMLQMTERMDAAAQGLREGDAKIVLFSGHDTTIMPIVASLVGDKIDRWPPYVANVVRIELSPTLDVDSFLPSEQLMNDRPDLGGLTLCFLCVSFLLLTLHCQSSRNPCSL